MQKPLHNLQVVFRNSQMSDKISMPPCMWICVNCTGSYRGYLCYTHHHDKNIRHDLQPILDFYNNLYD